MTALEAFEQFLDTAGLKDAAARGGVKGTDFTLEAKAHPKIIGYSGFGVVVDFDEEGNLNWIGIWE